MTPEFFLRRFFRYGALGLAVILAPQLRSAPSSDLEQLRGLNVSNVKIPFYHNQHLQAMIFALRATNRDQNLVGSDIVIELLRKKTDVDLIRDAWKLRPYPLRSPLSTVVKFWHDRIRYSEAVVVSAHGEIDRHEQIATGNQPVFLRSPLLDLDGRGFFVDFRKQNIRINSDVKIILRTGKESGYGFEGGPIPKKYEFIRARSDALLIDMAQKQIILVGNVKVTESRFELNCDRLTLFLEDKSEAKKTAKKPGEKNPLADTGVSVSGVSRIFADGDVVVNRIQSTGAKPEERQQLFADHLLYDVRSAKLVLTGNERDPRMVNGTAQFLSGKEITLYKNKEQLIVSDRCHLESVEKDKSGKLKKRTIDSDYGNFDAKNNVNDFLGHVRVDDPQMHLTCDQMRVVLRTVPGAGPKKEGRKSSGAGSTFDGLGDFDALSSGRRELDRIICRNNVVVESKNAATTPGGPGSRLNSDHAFLDYRKNLLTFTGGVKARHTGSTLDCNKLELFLVDRPSGTAGATVPGVEARTSKIIKHAVATGKVHMTDKESTLDTDRLTLEFIPAPKNAPTPGLLQSGGMRISTIRCDGNVTAVNRGKKGTASKEKSSDRLGSALGSLGRSSGTRVLKAQHAFTDMRKRYSEFHDQVNVKDENGELSCRDLYVYARKAQNATAPKTASPTSDDPDADPFALPIENSAPTEVVLAQGVELDRVICEHEVVLSRKDALGAVQQIGGERAVYKVADRKIHVTGTPEARPYLRYGNHRQKCDRITIHLDREQVDTEGKTETELIDSGKK